MNAKLNLDIPFDELMQIEEYLRKVRHVERYRYIRRFCAGSVLDIGCGCGYGSYIISLNPDVESVVGIDRDYSKSVTRDKYLAMNPKLSFTHDTFDHGTKFEKSFNMATIIEVLEHVPQPSDLIRHCCFLKIPFIIATVPAYKTTHFNQYHLRDFTIDEFKELFESCGYKPVSTIIFHDEVFLGHFVRI